MLPHSSTLPTGLRYSERKLWEECEEARPVIERLARIRDRNYELRGAIGAIRIGCPNQPTDHPCDGMFTRIIGICREVMHGDQDGDGQGE